MFQGLNNEYLLIGGAFMLFAAAAYFVLAPNSSQKMVGTRAKKVMAKYSKVEGIPAVQGSSSTLKKKQLDMNVSSSIISMPSISKLREKLDRTGRKISLLQYLLASLGVSGVSFLVFKICFWFWTGAPRADDDLHDFDGSPYGHRPLG